MEQTRPSQIIRRDFEEAARLVVHVQNEALGVMSHDEPVDKFRKMSGQILPAPALQTDIRLRAMGQTRVIVPADVPHPSDS